MDPEIMLGHTILIHVLASVKQIMCPITTSPHLVSNYPEPTSTRNKHAMAVNETALVSHTMPSHAQACWCLVTSFDIVLCTKDNGF